MQITNVSPVIPYAVSVKWYPDHEESVQLVLVDLKNRAVYSPTGIIFEEQEFVNAVIERIKKNRPDLNVPTLPQEVITAIGRANNEATIKTSEYSKVE